MVHFFSSRIIFSVYSVYFNNFYLHSYSKKFERVPTILHFGWKGSGKPVIAKRRKQSTPIIGRVRFSDSLRDYS